MRLTLEMLDVAEKSENIMLKFDQLTIVRNHVRNQFDFHKVNADGEIAHEIELDVAWQDGDVETLVFDANVGYPIEPVRDWAGDWLKELRT